MDRITLSNREILAYLERPRIKGNGQTSIIEIGRAFKEIRDNRLHKEISPNFYDYCLIRFGLVPKAVDFYLDSTSLPRPELKEEKINKDNNTTIVYFIQAGEFIKIGFTKDFKRRLASLSTTSPIPIIPLGFISGTKKDEKDLHDKFAAYRHHGEWFTAAPEIIRFIKEINHE